MPRSEKVNDSASPTRIQGPEVIGNLDDMMRM